MPCLRRIALSWTLAASPLLAQSERLVQAPAPPPILWPDQAPADCPFPKSTELNGIVFTGVHSDYRCGDTWYPSWASDGNLYSPWTDGVTDGVAASSGGDGAITGNAVMVGDDPLDLQIRNTSAPQPASPRPYEGRYPCGSLVHNGIWYYGTYCLGPNGSVQHEGFTYNWPVLGPMPGFRISTDLGKTWTPSPRTPEKPLFPEPDRFMGPVKMGAPHFVDFGRNLQHSPDGKAYLVGMGAIADDPQPRYANLSWVSADQAYLARVAPSPATINDPAAYEYYAGTDKAGDPRWSRDFRHIQPLLEWNNNMGCVTVTYNAPLRKYLMCVTDGWPTVARMHSYILEADRLTGPWRRVVYLRAFGEQGYFLNVPSKFIQADGRTLWLCYSANFSPGWNNVVLRFNPPGGRYGLCLHECRILRAGESVTLTPPPNPLQHPSNAASEARVTTSSTHPEHPARGAVDGVVSGFPDNKPAEWASLGESTNAWIRLDWTIPRRISRVQLFDRPNALDQVVSGILELSDGLRVPLHQPLPDGALRGVEVLFPARAVSWLRFTVTAVKPGTPNVGLSEIAAFSDASTAGSSATSQTR